MSENVDLKRKKDKRTERQDTKMMYHGEYQVPEFKKHMMKKFDRQRYKVVIDTQKHKIGFQKAQHIADNLSDVLDIAPDKWMTDVKTLRISLGNMPQTGSYNFRTKEMSFNLDHLNRYGKGGDYRFIKALVAHETGHARYNEWPLEKKKVWAKKMKEIGPINSYVEKFLEIDERRQKNEKEKGKGSFSRVRQRVIEPLQAAIKNKIENGVPLTKFKQEDYDRYKKQFFLKSDEEFIDGTFDMIMDNYVWMGSNMYANEQHSAIHEAFDNTNVLGEYDKGGYNEWFDEDRFDKAKEVYENEYKDTSDVGAAGREFDENKHKRDEKGRWATKDSNALKRKKDKRLGSQHIRPDKLGSMRKWANEIERTFDRQRYKVRVDIRNQNLSLSNILDTTTMLSKILDKVPDKDMEKVKKIVLKTGGENVSTGSYSFNKKEMMFNLEHMHKYGGKRKREFMQAIVDHEVAHARFAEWDLDKMKRWKALTEEVGPINTYVESMKKYDKRIKKEEDNLALKSFSLNHNIVKSLQGRLRDAIAAGGAVDSYDRSEIDFYKNYLELDSDEEFLSKDVNDRYEKYSWLRWNKYANEQHSALFEEYHSNVIEDSGYYHDSYGRDRLNKMKEKYHAEFEK